MKVSHQRFLVVMLLISLCMGMLADTVLYAADVSHEGDIVLTGNDVMVIENMTYTQTGNIYIRDNAKLTIKNATLILNERYHEEFVLEVHEYGKLEILDSTFDISIPGENYEWTFFDHSTITVTNSNMNKGKVCFNFGHPGGSFPLQAFKGTASISNTQFQSIDFNITTQGAGVIHVSDSMFHAFTFRFRDGYTTNLSDLKPGYFASWVYNENGNHLTVERSTIGLFNIVCDSACNVIAQNCEIFQFGPTTALSTIHMKAKDSTIRDLRFHGLERVTASFWGLKTGLLNNFKLSEHSQGVSLPEIILENTEVKQHWTVNAFGGSNISVDDSIISYGLFGYPSIPTFSKITNSTIVGRLYFDVATNSVIEFDNTTIGELNLNVPPNSVTMKGNITFASNAFVGNWRTPSIIKRNYPLTVMGVSGGTLPTTSLFLSDKTGKVVWTSQTDAQGKANFDIEFTDANHNDAWNLEIILLGKKQTRAITLLTSTPVEVHNVFEITATAGSNGAISPSGSVSVNDGATQTFMMHPAKSDVDRVQADGVYMDGSHRVSDVLVDGASVGAVSSYTFNNVKANHTISASFTAATPSGAAVIYDDFGGSGIDTSRWTVNDQNNAFSVSGGYLNVNATGNASYHSLSSKQTFTGDFDIVLPYKDFQTTTTQVGGTYPFVSLLIMGSNSNTEIYRGFTNQTFLTVCYLDGVFQGGYQAAATSASGWLRVIRTGSTVRTFYREDNNWNLLGNYTNFTGEVSWSIRSYSGDSGTFQVSSDGVYSLPFSFYFPHIATSSPWQTEIALINTGGQTVTGILKGYSDAGQLVENKGITLSANGRRQIIVADEFANHASIGYMIFEADSSSVQGYTKFYIAGTYRAAIPAVKEVNTSDIYIPHIASSNQWWTGVSLANTTSAAKQLIMTFNNGQSRQVILNANEHRAFIISSLFNDQPQPGIQSAVITNAAGIVGLLLFGSADGGNLLDGLLLTDKTASTLYYPHVASDNAWWTGIVAYNPSTMASTISITPYSEQGAPLTPSTLSIAGKGKYIGMVSGLGLAAGTAWFRIDSTQPLSGFELFATHDENQLAAYAGGGGTGAKAGVFPKIEKSGWTGIAFVNTEATAATVTLTAYDDNGTALATRVLPVGGYAKVVHFAEDIFPQNISGATYIAYSSDRNVVGFQLNGTSDNMMLDGLPALGGTN